MSSFPCQIHRQQWCWSPESRIGVSGCLWHLDMCHIWHQTLWNQKYEMKNNQWIIFFVSRHKKADVMPQTPVQLKALSLWDTVVASQRPTGQFLWYCVADMFLNYHWLTSITSVTQFSILWEKKGNPWEGVSPSISVCLWVICSYLPFSPSLPPFFLLYLLAL